MGSRPPPVRRPAGDQPTNDGRLPGVGGPGRPLLLAVQARRQERGCCWQLQVPGGFTRRSGVLGAPPALTHRPVESVRPHGGVRDRRCSEKPMEKADRRVRERHRSPRSGGPRSTGILYGRRTAVLRPKSLPASRESGRGGLLPSFDDLGEASRGGKAALSATPPPPSPAGFADLLAWPSGPCGLSSKATRTGSVGTVGESCPMHEAPGLCLKSASAAPAQVGLRGGVLGEMLLSGYGTRLRRISPPLPALASASAGSRRSRFQTEPYSRGSTAAPRKE